MIKTLSPRQQLSVRMDVIQPPSNRNDYVHRIRREPIVYLNIPYELKSDPEIALEALRGVAVSEDTYLHLRIVDEVFEFNPHPVLVSVNSGIIMCYHVLETEGMHENFIKIYMERVGPYLIEYIQNNGMARNERDWSDRGSFFDTFPEAFYALPESLRVHPTILGSAIINLREIQGIEKAFVSSTPQEVFIRYPALLQCLVDRYHKSGLEYWHLVPTAFRQCREILHNLIVHGHEIPLSMFPNDLCSDRKFFMWVLSFNALYFSIQWGNSLLNLMSDSLKSDKEFIKKCAAHHPSFILCNCKDELQLDLDIFLNAAEAARSGNKLSEFIDALGDRLFTFGKAIGIMIEQLDFWAFLTCLLKCSQEPIHDHPLRLLECGSETSIALKQLIRSYVVDGEDEIDRMKDIFDDILREVVPCGTRFPKLIQYASHETIARAVHRALDRHIVPPYQNVPAILWFDRDFVLKWAQKDGNCFSIIPKHFHTDFEICLACYKKVVVDAKNRPTPSVHKCIAWISENLKADKGFVLQFAFLHPIILDSCSNDIRLDEGFLLDLAYESLRTVLGFERFAETALLGGWGVALMRLRAKLLELEAFLSFNTLMKERNCSVFAINSRIVRKSMQSFMGTEQDFARHACVWNYPAVKRHLVKAKGVEDLKIFSNVYN